MPSKTHYWEMSDDHLIFTWKVTWEGWPSDRIFIPWISLTIMSYSYHIHIDQQSINKWKYQEILDLSMNRIIDNVKDCLFKCNLQHLTNLHLFILQEGVRYGRGKLFSRFPVKMKTFTFLDLPRNRPIHCTIL